MMGGQGGPQEEVTFVLGPAKGTPGRAGFQADGTAGTKALHTLGVFEKKRPGRCRKGAGEWKGETSRCSRWKGGARVSSEVTGASAAGLG